MRRPKNSASCGSLTNRERTTFTPPRDLLRPDFHSQHDEPYFKRPDNARLMTPTPPPVAYPKFCLSLEEQQVLQADCLPYCEPVTATVPARRVPRCRDPFDLPFLSLALAGTIVKPAQLRTRLGIT